MSKFGPPLGPLARLSLHAPTAAPEPKRPRETPPPARVKVSLHYEGVAFAGAPLLVRRTLPQNPALTTPMAESDMWHQAAPDQPRYSYWLVDADALVLKARVVSVASNRTLIDKLQDSWTQASLLPHEFAWSAVRPPPDATAQRFDKPRQAGGAPEGMWDAPWSEATSGYVESQDATALEPNVPEAQRRLLAAAAAMHGVYITVPSLRGGKSQTVLGDDARLVLLVLLCNPKALSASRVTLGARANPAADISAGAVPRVVATLSRLLWDMGNVALRPPDVGDYVDGDSSEDSDAEASTASLITDIAKAQRYVAAVDAYLTVEADRRHAAHVLATVVMKLAAAAVAATAGP